MVYLLFHLNSDAMYEKIIAKLNSLPRLAKAKVQANPENILFPPYKAKVIFDGGDWGTFGKGSLDCAKRIFALEESDKTNSVIDIGNFCQIAQAMILVGAEHKNNEIINDSLWFFRDIRERARMAGTLVGGIHSKGKVTIGSNVVISMNATILSGVTIGCGAVIGAGSVVTKNVPPFAIVGGNPAKLIRYRFDEKTIEALLKIKWWDFNLDFFERNLAAIQQLESTEMQEKFTNIDQLAYDYEPNYLVFQERLDPQRIKSYEVIGAEVKGKLIALKDLPEMFRFFVDQVKAPPGAILYLIKDIFKLSGLV